MLDLPAAALAQQQELRLGRDLFVGGNSITVRDQVAGDAILAGGQVSLTGPIGGDAAVAGGEVAIGGSIAQDLYAAGGQLRIDGAVMGSARLAGGDIRISRGARIADGLTAAGGRIALEGEMGSYANIAGGSLSIDGKINGNVEAAGGSLRLGPTAVIQGQLTYRGPQAAEVEAGAQVLGGIRNVSYEPPMYQRSLPVFLGIMALIWFIGWAIVGALLLGLLPHQTRYVTLTARARPWFAALIGLITLVVTPFVIVLLLMSVVGIPLAILLALLYLVLLPFGYLAGVATIGDWLLPRLQRDPAQATTGWRIGAFLIALLAVAILTQIPFIGWLGGLILLMLGMGALLLALFQPGRPRPTVEQPSPDEGRFASSQVS
jgi:cytoskeletal protein CcmA (bactofilin family)